MATRVQVILAEEEKELFQRQAAQEGLSLSAWLRQAGQQRLRVPGEGTRIETSEDLAAFFAACNTREEGREPDWEEHLATIEQSKRAGTSGT